MYDNCHRKTHSNITTGNLYVHCYRMPPEDVDPYVQKPPNFSFYTCSRRKLKPVDERNKKLSTADGKTEHMLTEHMLIEHMLTNTDS